MIFKATYHLQDHVKSTSNHIQERFFNVNKLQYALRYCRHNPECMLANCVLKLKKAGVNRESIRQEIRARRVREELNNNS